MVHVLDVNDNRPVLVDFFLLVTNEAHAAAPDDLPRMPVL